MKEEIIKLPHIKNLFFVILSPDKCPKEGDYFGIFSWLLNIFCHNQNQQTCLSKYQEIYCNAIFELVRERHYIIWNKIPY